jgi:phosphonate transport system permease protein
MSAAFEAAEAEFRRRRLVTLAAPLAIIAYFLYAFFAFDVPGLIDRARPDRAQALVSDMVSYKVVVARDNRSGEVEASNEGERLSVLPEFPDWIRQDGETTVIDLEDGYRVVYAPEDVRFTVPGYGEIVVIASRRNGVEATFPGGAQPDWVSLSRARFDATIEGRRLIGTRSGFETHRRFWGWEEFFFQVSNPLHGMSLGEVIGVAWSDDRIDPERSNVRFILDSFLDNRIWIHRDVLIALGETVLMAFIGTAFAAIAALPLAFFAASNLTPSLFLRFGLRRLFDFLRGVDGLIWTIILSRAFGPGPMTGALAMALTDTGSFGKLFSEALENIDRKQVEGVTATGAGPGQRALLGVLPQITPVLLSQVLYFFESNMRSATIIGAIVGGGIGLLLTQAINTQQDWENVTWYVLLIIVIVVITDWISAGIRQKLIKG